MNVSLGSVISLSEGPNSTSAMATTSLYYPFNEYPFLLASFSICKKKYSDASSMSLLDKPVVCMIGA